MYYIFEVLQLIHLYGFVSVLDVIQDYENEVLIEIQELSQIHELLH